MMKTGSYARSKSTLKPYSLDFWKKIIYLYKGAEPCVKLMVGRYIAVLLSLCTILTPNSSPVLGKGL